MDVHQHIIFFKKIKPLQHPQEKVIIDRTPNLPLPPLFFFVLQILKSRTIYCCKQGKQNNSSRQIATFLWSESLYECLSDTKRATLTGAMSPGKTTLAGQVLGVEARLSVIH